MKRQLLISRLAHISSNGRLGTGQDYPISMALFMVGLIARPPPDHLQAQASLGQEFGFTFREGVSRPNAVQEQEMSIDFYSTTRINSKDLFDGRLEKFGVVEYVSDETSEHRRCLHDGSNCIWMDVYDDGTVGPFVSWGMNSPVHILVSIAKAFDTDINLYDEYEIAYGPPDTPDPDLLKKQTWKTEEERYALLTEYLTRKVEGFTGGLVAMANMLREQGYECEFSPPRDDSGPESNH